MVLVSGWLLWPTPLRAWDTSPDADGLYDGFYNRPTFFPDWEQPSTWPNAMYYLCDVRLGSENGPRMQSYEIAVYDQNDELRYCGRSLAKQDYYSVLTIRGMDGTDTFHFKVLYGDDFANPTIADIPDVSVPFVTNKSVGTKEAPFVIVVPSDRTYLSELDTEAPAAKTNAKVTLERSINADEWGTICLPFALAANQLETAFGTTVQLADFAGVEVDFEADETTVKSIHVKFNTATDIVANHPYIIKVGADVTEINAEGVDIVALGEDEVPAVDCDEQKVKIGSKYYYFYNSFIGNYVNGFKVPEQKLFLSGGKFWYSTGQAEMMAYRAYFDFYDVLPEVDNAGARVMMSIDGFTTDLNPATGSGALTGHGEVYDLQGRRVAAPTKGLYIRDGKKYIIK